MHHKRDDIASLPLFSGLAADELPTIFAAARRKTYEKGHVFHAQDDAVREIILVIEGSVKIMEVGSNGSQVILRMCGPGELVGAETSASQRHYSAAEATNACSVLVWDIRTFEALLARFPLLRANLAHAVREKLRDMEECFREISCERVAARLSRQVLRLADKIGRPVDHGLEINLLREELAQLVGTTLFTVSRLLCEWNRLGIVELRREAVIVSNRRAIEELSERFGQMPQRR